MWLGPHLMWTDLTRVSRNTVLFWSGDWNDVISSLHTWVGTVSLFEHINQQGSSITFQPGQHIASLVPLGWNDRASTIINWG